MIDTVTHITLTDRRGTDYQLNRDAEAKVFPVGEYPGGEPKPARIQIWERDIPDGVDPPDIDEITAESYNGKEYVSETVAVSFESRGAVAAGHDLDRGSVRFNYRVTGHHDDREGLAA